MKVLSFNDAISGVLKASWWVQINTQMPTCTYYFGPFDSKKDAKLSQACYIEDLTHERAQGITAEIKRMRPKKLTIYADE